MASQAREAGSIPARRICVLVECVIQGLSVGDTLRKEDGKWSIPLQDKLKEERPPKTKTLLAYGLREGMDFHDDDYIEVVRTVANLLGSQARDLYVNFIKPQLSNLE